VADPNRALFEEVVGLLAPVLNELVFVGGCTTGFFVTDPAATGIRPTKDVDAIVDVTSYAKYTALADRLRALGLVEDTSEGAPLCRWRHGHVIVDVMPTDPGVLGFSNQWYPDAIETALTVRIAGHAVRIVTPALFLATKLEAFHGRGSDDILTSHDLEDIIAVIDGRPEIVDDVAHAAADVRAYIASEIQALLDNPDFVEALAGFLLPDPASQARRRLLEERLRTMSARSGRSP
jgi:predicted nucleotidyltransferase